MPGTLFDQPHHFRMSLTATMETIDRALPDLTEIAAALSTTVAGASAPEPGRPHP
jgi:aspartate aminotransferase